MSTIYVICPDFTPPAGGVMKLYELVDTLNANGIKSFIVHNKNGFRVDWFKNSTKIDYINSIKVNINDLVIIPEIFGKGIIKYFPGIRKIIFNQNSYLTLTPFNENIEKAAEVYLHKDIIQVITVSKYDYEGLNWLFPGIKLSRLFYGINDGLFYFNPDKIKQIAVIPRKSDGDYEHLEELLKLKDSLQDFSIKIIDNIPIEQCAEILRESAIFLSFSHKEGFGLPPAEAMACGCLVIGYHGQGGKEFFKKDLTINIEQSDLINYARQVNKAVQEFQANPQKIIRIGQEASEFILKKYSLANQEKSILNIIKPFI